MKKKRSGRGARLGQHFLVGTWAAKKLVEAVAVRPDEIILEIGPGKGALTEELLATGNKVVAIEKDETLAKALEDVFPKECREGQLKIISDDIRNTDLAKILPRGKQYVVAANIPYYITGEILRKFLTTTEKPRAVAFLVQKEVAERILTRDGKESILSISIKAYGTPRIIAKVSKGNFSPPPSVDSAILLIENISQNFFDGIREEDFFAVVKAGFSSKRKFLAGNLSRVLHKKDASRALAACHLEEKVRAEDLPLTAWKCLARELFD